MADDALHSLPPDLEVTVLRAANILGRHPVAFDAVVRRDGIPVRWERGRRFLKIADLIAWRDGADARRAEARKRRSA
ncbi:MAG: hypothetical protein ACYC4P_11665 [Thermoanaerobaculia bacterium]